MGQRCAMGYVDIWFFSLPDARRCGPYTILAKFPLRDPPGVKTPVLLGLDFQLRHNATIALPPPPQDGLMSIP